MARKLTNLGFSGRTIPEVYEQMEPVNKKRLELALQNIHQVATSCSDEEQIVISLIVTEVITNARP